MEMVDVLILIAQLILELKLYAQQSPQQSMAVELHRNVGNQHQ